MDISLNDEHLEMARQARKFCLKEAPFEFVLSMLGEEVGVTPELWSLLAEMGWTAMLIPEDYGGLGLDLLDLVVVLEEMGKSVLPGPFFSSILLAAQAIGLAGSEEQKNQYLPGLAEGSLRGTLALSEAEAGADPEFIRLKAVRNGSGFVLNGAKSMVPDARSADFLIVAAQPEEDESVTGGVSLFLIESGLEGLEIVPLSTMDGTRKMDLVKFENLRVGPENILGKIGAGRPILDRVLNRAWVGLAADSVGGAQQALDIGVDYAKIRVQFGRPIGSFQTIKHRCAEMYAAVESARSLLYYAAWAQDQDDYKEASLAASAAKVRCCDAYVHNAAGALQILGAIGFTWEHEIHLYLKRAKANQVHWGDPAYHRERIIRLLHNDF